MPIKNLIYIHSHDSGRFVQPYGAPAPTPNIQRFAEDAVVFRKAFSASPACSPSRACLLTGQWPHSAGMLGLANFGFSMPSYDLHLAPQLSRRGVRSVLAGIQHISPETSVVGYDEVRTPSNLSTLDDSSRAIADVAVDFLASDLANERFFLDVGFIDTHRPYPETGRDDPRWLAPPPPLPDAPETRADMSGHLFRLRALDAAVGRVIDAVEVQGLSEETLVIVTTDHGLAWPGMKLTLTDAGIGVMLMMRGGDVWRGGRVIDAMVSQIDLYPTIFEMMGFPVPNHVQGLSLGPLVEEKTDHLRDELFAETNFHVDCEPQRCVRTDRWKYIRRYVDRPTPMLAHTDPSPSRSLMQSFDYYMQPYEKELLFDTRLDPFETNNLADSPAHKDILEELRGRLNAWQGQTADPLLAGALNPPPGSVVNNGDVWEPEW